MSYPELLFIKAEAAERGFIPGGDALAEEAYYAAIRASWDHMKLMEPLLQSGEW